MGHESLVKRARTRKLFEVGRSGGRWIPLANIESAQGLLANEKEMLKELLLQGNYLFRCDYNKSGHVEALTVGVRGELLDRIYFPTLSSLSISYKVPETIDFLKRHRTSIRTLDLISKSLEQIPDLSYLANLEELNLTRNRINEVNWFGNLTNLRRLNLSENNIKTLESFVKISPCKDLREIDLSSNEVSDLCEFRPLTNFPKLENIVLEFNKIEDINITYDVPRLTHFKLNNNIVKKITALKNLSGLKVLDLTNWEEDREKGWNELRSIENLENLPNLEKVCVDGNPVKNFSGLEKLPKLWYIGEMLKDLVDEDYIFYGLHDYFKKIGFKVSRDSEFGDISIYKPKFPTLKHKINKYITLKLIRDEFDGSEAQVSIFVNRKLFRQCNRLLFQIPFENVRQHKEIQSIDELAEILGSNEVEIDLAPEEGFWGHCSNLQVWVEHDYDTRLLHRSIAFPLLKELMILGDPLAEKVFKEEIAQRYDSGHPTVRKLLEVEGYLRFLSKEELESLN